MRPEAIEILLVDDNSADVDLTLHALRKSAHIDCIHVARDGEEALKFLFCKGPYEERAGQPPPHLILLDLKLPKMDGLTVLQKLRQGYNDAAVLIMTADTTSSNAIKAHAPSLAVAPEDEEALPCELPGSLASKPRSAVATALASVTIVPEPAVPSVTPCCENTAAMVTIAINKPAIDVLG